MGSLSLPPPPKPCQHGVEALIHPEQPMPRGSAESDGPRRGQPRLLVPGEGTVERAPGKVDSGLGTNPSYMANEFLPRKVPGGL